MTRRPWLPYALWAAIAGAVVLVGQPGFRLLRGAAPAAVWLGAAGRSEGTVGSRPRLSDPGAARDGLHRDRRWPAPGPHDPPGVRGLERPDHRLVPVRVRRPGPRLSRSTERDPGGLSGGPGPSTRDELGSIHPRSGSARRGARYWLAVHCAGDSVAKASARRPVSRVLCPGIACASPRRWPSI